MYNERDNIAACSVVVNNAGPFGAGLAIANEFHVYCSRVKKMEIDVMDKIYFC